MKKISFLLIFIVALFFFPACRTMQVLKPITADSTSVTVKYVKHDSIIKIPGSIVMLHDTLKISAPCPEINYNSYINHGVSSNHLVIKNDVITDTCRCDSAIIKIQELNEQINTLRSEKTTQVIQKIIVSPLTAWQGFCNVFTEIGLVLIGIFIIIGGIYLYLKLK